MKKLLLILLCVPLIGSGQTAYDYFIEAKEQINNEEYQLAIDLYSECINLLKNDSKGMNKNGPATYNNRGNAYYNLGNYEDAIADYTRAIRIDPDYASAYFNRGDAYDELENYEDAIADYTRAIRIDPDYSIAYFNRGLLYAKKLNNLEDAIADFTRAIRIDPDYTSAYLNRGLAKEEAGLDYCSDYKRACDLGNEKGCEWYKEDNCR